MGKRISERRYRRGGRLISGPYGSGFLQFNKKGMDLDYLCVFDLGVLKESSPKDQALELITRINDVLKTVVKVNGSIPNTSALYVYYNGPMDKDGNLMNIDKAKSIIEERLGEINTNSEVRNAFYDAKGDSVPADLHPFEIVLPVNTRIKMATDTVKYYQDMFPGIREISVQFFYSVGIKKGGKVVYLNVSPLYEKAGSPIPLFDLMVNNVFLSAKDVNTYKTRLMYLPPKQIIINNAKRVYLQSLYEYESGNYLKQLKRIHQCYNSLKWSFAPQERTAIEAQLRKWLGSDWAIISEDISEQGGKWLEDGRDMIDAFVKAGDLEKLINFLRSASGMEIKYPKIKPELADLKKLIKKLERKDNLEERFKELIQIGERISEKTGPTEEEAGQLLKIFGDKLDELGFKKINIYNIRDRKASLSKQELFEAGFDPRKINLPPEDGGIEKIGGYEYVSVDKIEKGEEPIKTILFRAVFTGKPAEKYKKYCDAIEWRRY